MTNVRVEDFDWATLPISARAELLRAGIPFPGETPEERRCRIKAALGLLDDEDVAALANTTGDTLARHRVKGTGPRPIRVLRTVFYQVEDVKIWMLAHRDVVVERKRAPA